MQNDRWTRTVKKEDSKKNDKTYDILVLDQNNDLCDYDTSETAATYNPNNRSLNRSQRVGILADSRLKRSKQERYKQFTLRDYTKTKKEENLYAKSGGLGPEIGGEKWIEEKMKRERIKDFANKLTTMKKFGISLKQNL